MKKGLAAVLAALCCLSQPIYVQARSEPSKEIIEVTYEEAQELLKIAWCEAGNQGILGQQYVMSTIINRVNSPDFPDTIHDVIYQPHQYATSRMDKAEPTWETHYALAAIESGDIIPEIVAFETKTSNVLDKFFTEAFTYKDHKYYTLSE